MRVLLEKKVDEFISLGYAERLDFLSDMQPVNKLYHGLVFKDFQQLLALILYL